MIPLGQRKGPERPRPRPAGTCCQAYPRQACQMESERDRDVLPTKIYIYFLKFRHISSAVHATATIYVLLLTLLDVQIHKLIKY